MSTVTAFAFLELQRALRPQECCEQVKDLSLFYPSLQTGVAQPSLQKADFVLVTTLFIAML